MLAEIYNWFTEGFDTADLKDAKALLERALSELGDQCAAQNAARKIRRRLQSSARQCADPLARNRAQVRHHVNPAGRKFCGECATPLCRANAPVPSKSAASHLE